MDTPFRVVTDLPRILYSLHRSPGAAHKAAIALSSRAGSKRIGPFRVERWVEQRGWVEVSTYVDGIQQ